MTVNENLKTYSLKDIKNFKINGRTNEEMVPLPLFWNNSGVEVNVTGTELWVDVSTDSDFYEPWVAVELNGALLSRQMLLPGEHSICLFRSMSADSVKNVKFYRELQAMNMDVNCHVLVKGFKSDGEFMPIEDKKIKIEFVGDSITSGEGTYGAKDDMEWLSMYMSSSVNYANMIGKNLNADISILSQGGWGVFTGWDNNFNSNMPSIYEKVCGISSGPVNEKLGSQRDYDFSKWQPDAIVVNLGTNDCGAFDQPPLEVEGRGMCKLRRNEDGSFAKEDALLISKAVTDFLKVLRKNNPKAHILWVYGMIGYELAPVLMKGISDYRDETEDINVTYMALPNTLEGEFGSRWHPGIPSHRKAATIITDYLKTKLGI